MSLPRKLLETATNWLLRQMLDRWGVAVLSGVGVVGLTSLERVRHFLWADHALPGWSIVVTAWLTVSLLGYVVIQQARTLFSKRRMRRWEPMPFEACGMRWRLTINFWSSYRTFRAEDMLITGTILGPLCPSCELDVSDELVDGKERCGGCGQTLAPTVPIRAERKPGIVSANNSDPLFPIRKAAYRQAQAKAMKNELRHP